MPPPWPTDYHFWEGWPFHSCFVKFIKHTVNNILHWTRSPTKLLLFYSQLQQCQSSHCSTSITDIYLHYQVQGYVMRVSFIFLVLWQMLIFWCGVLPGFHWKLKMGLMCPVTGEQVASRPFWTVYPLFLTIRECSVTVNLMQTLNPSPAIKIKYVEPVFTIMTRAISNLSTTLKRCYFTCVGHTGWL